jgi:hypothetical protein
VIEHGRDRGEENYYWKNLKDEDEADGAWFTWACGKWSEEELGTAL